MLKIGDTVMFTNEKSRYAKWFYSQIGIVKSMNPTKTHCSVKWCFPVKYFEGHTTVSSFKVSDFSISS